MTFIIYPTNIDYLIDDVRLPIGDVEEKRFSDSLIRTSLINGVKMLQRKWSNRYLVYRPEMLVPDQSTVPSGFVYVSTPNGVGIAPSGLERNDIFRNSAHSFLDPGPYPISQEDEVVIVAAAKIILSQALYSSSSEGFQSWSDAEYSFSNIQSGKAMQDLYNGAITELNSYFGTQLTKAARGRFNPTVVRIVDGLQ